MNNKIKQLKDLLRSYGSVIVCFSGGIDSTLLCYYANEVLKDNFIAITTVSETLPAEELIEAEKLAQKYKWKHLIIPTRELDNELFTSNTPERCKWCKDIRFKEINKIAIKKNIRTIVTGNNIDDLSDYRPGLKHSQSLGIKNPLIETGFTESEIRRLAKKIGLPNYNKPSSPCLASRIPYNIRITPNVLNMIQKSEIFLKSLGYKIVRVRHYNNLAKIELKDNDIPGFILHHSNIVNDKLKQIGYTHVCIDLNGYKMGSLNKDITVNNE